MSLSLSNSLSFAKITSVNVLQTNMCRTTAALPSAIHQWVCKEMATFMCLIQHDKQVVLVQKKRKCFEVDGIICILLLLLLDKTLFVRVTLVLVPTACLSIPLNKSDSGRRDLHICLTPTFQYFYTAISAISVTYLCHICDISQLCRRLPECTPEKI